MKKTLILLVLAFTTSIYYYSQDIDKRLLKKYSKKEIKAIQKNTPDEYTFLINALEKGVFISEIPEKKASTIVFDGTLNINPNEVHTFMSLGKEITDRYQYYKIEGTNKMLAILPRIALDPKLLKEKTKK